MIFTIKCIRKDCTIKIYRIKFITQELDYILEVSEFEAPLSSPKPLSIK